MLTLTSLTETGLLRSMGLTQSALSRSLERLSTGSRLNSAADDPAGLVMSNTLRAEMGGLAGQLASVTRLEGMVSTASTAVGQQVSLLQEIRSKAAAAASDTATSAERAAYQTEIENLAADLDRIATTTSFNQQSLLDGSLGTRTYSLGAAGSTLVNIDFSQATTAGALGQVAEVAGTVTTTTGLSAGELTLNGVDVGATFASDDSVSSSGNAASAISLAAAIERADVGVSAQVQATTVDLGTVATGSFLAGDLTINGVDIGAVSVQAGDATNTLQNAINAVTGSTGVTASLDGGGNLILTAADGRNIVTAGNNTDGGGTVSTDPGTATYTGSVILTSSSTITVGGTNPASAGLTAGSTAVNTNSSVANLDVTTQAAAEATIRQVDQALAGLGEVQASFGAAQNRIDSVQYYLQSSYDTLSSAHSQIVDADIAAETAELAKNELLLNTQVALLAQAGVNQSFVVDLLQGLFDRA